MKNLFDLTELFSELLKNNALADLLKFENVSEDTENTLAFKNNNAELKVENTENGFALSYSYDSTKNQNLRKEFTLYCDQIEDDDFFKEVCDLYTEVYGSLDDLWKNLTEEGVNNFKECVIRTAEEAMEEADEIVREMEEIIKLTQN